MGNMNVTFSLSSMQILLNETRKVEMVFKCLYSMVHSRNLFFIYSFRDLKALL